jgi:UDP-glucose 4-epimerase
MNILITGGLGHIGSKLIREYANKEVVSEIRVLDNFLTQRYCSLFDLPKNKKYVFIEGDINNEKDLTEAMKDVEIVIHLASITDAPNTIKNPEETEKVNLIGTKKVIETAIKMKIDKLVFPSTTSVYGEAENEVDENTTDLKPATPYAETKLAAERLLQKAYTENGLKTYILRFGTIFGKSIGMRFQTAVNKFTYLACMNKPVTVWENALDQKRPYLGLNDAIRAIEFAIENCQPGEVYNVLTANHTVREIIETIKLFKPQLEIKLVDSPILNQKSYTVSNEKICNLGFQFKDDLSKEIEETTILFEGIVN